MAGQSTPGATFDKVGEREKSVVGIVALNGMTLPYGRCQNCLFADAEMLYASSSELPRHGPLPCQTQEWESAEVAAAGPSVGSTSGSAAQPQGAVSVILVDASPLVDAHVELFPHHARVRCPGCDQIDDQIFNLRDPAPFHRGAAACRRRLSGAARAGGEPRRIPPVAKGSISMARVLVRLVLGQRQTG